MGIPSGIILRLIPSKSIKTIFELSVLFVLRLSALTFVLRLSVAAGFSEGFASSVFTDSSSLLALNGESSVALKFITSIFSVSLKSDTDSDNSKNKYCAPNITIQIMIRDITVIDSILIICYAIKSKIFMPARTPGALKGATHK